MGIFDRLKRSGKASGQAGGESNSAKDGQREAPIEAALKDLYNQLAQQILRMIPGKWETVYYLGEVEQERSSWSSVFYFKDPDRGNLWTPIRFPRCIRFPIAYIWSSGWG